MRQISIIPLAHLFLTKKQVSTLMPALLLTAHDCVGHIHLVIGSNAIANARCTKSIEVGAKPLIIASPEAEVHYALQEKINSGQVNWIKRGFEDSDLTILGRDEIENVVDAVFVTLGGKEFLSVLLQRIVVSHHRLIRDCRNSNTHFNHM